MGNTATGENNVMMNAHNRLVAKYNDLQKQVAEKEQVWREQEHRYKNTDAKVRKLCVMILSKERKSDFFGQSFSWDSRSTDDLIGLAIESYETYNSSRTDLMRSIQAVAEQRRIAYDNLRTQFEMMKNSAAWEAKGQEQETDVSSAVEVAEEQKKDIPKSVDYKAQMAAQQGNITIGITEDDDDVSLEDVVQISEMATKAAAIALEEQQLKITPSEKKKRAAMKVAAAERNTLLLDKNAIMKNLSERCLSMIRAIGDTGVSELGSLRTVLEEQEKTPYSSSMVYFDYLKLVNNQLVIDQEVLLPLKGKNKLFWLSGIGNVIYKDITGKEPVEAQCIRVRKDHDNLEHGYGVLILKEVLEGKGIYKRVLCDRSDVETVLSSGEKYIPDIIAEGKFRSFFEYELNTHNTENFEKKLNKMACVTKFLNIVVGNVQQEKGVCRKVESWIASKSCDESMAAYRVRVSTISALKDSENIFSDSGWSHVYSLTGRTKHRDTAKEKVEENNEPTDPHRIV